MVSRKTPHKKKPLGTSLSKGAKAPEFVKIIKGRKTTHINFPIAAHPIEKRVMAFSLMMSVLGFGVYAYLKPPTAILTAGLIPYQLGAFVCGCYFGVKFCNLVIGRFYIHLGKLRIDMHYGPLAKRRLQRLRPKRIDQIYVEKVDGMLGPKYHVQAITRNKKEHTLYVTYHGRLAKYIEFILEDYMGIKNRFVHGEYGGTESDFDNFL